MNIMGKDQLHLIVRIPDKQENETGQKALPNLEH